MATRFGLLISLFVLLGPLLLLGGCIPAQDPLLPELKGRWSAPNAAKLRYTVAAERYANPPAQADASDCRNEYVMFEKHAVTLYMNGMVNPVFMVQTIKRDGTRLIIDGSAPMVAGGHTGRLELVLSNGEVHLDDVVNERGRSILYERFENEQARRLGITTVGDVFRLVLDVKPCRA